MYYTDKKYIYVSFKLHSAHNPSSMYFILLPAILTNSGREDQRQVLLWNEMISVYSGSCGVSLVSLQWVRATEPLWTPVKMMTLSKSLAWNWILISACSAETMTDWLTKHNVCPVSLCQWSAQQCWYLVVVNYSSDYMFSQSLTPCLFVLETRESLQNSVSQGASTSTSHLGVKTDPGHSFQPLLVTLGPMTHEVTRSI